MANGDKVTAVAKLDDLDRFNTDFEIAGGLIGATVDIGLSFLTHLNVTAFSHIMNTTTVAIEGSEVAVSAADKDITTNPRQQAVGALASKTSGSLRGRAASASLATKGHLGVMSLHENSSLLGC